MESHFVLRLRHSGRLSRSVSKRQLLTPSTCRRPVGFPCRKCLVSLNRKEVSLAVCPAPRQPASSPPAFRPLKPAPAGGFDFPLRQRPPPGGYERTRNHRSPQAKN